MARIQVDRTKCTGIGVCESLAGEYFELSDDGELLVLQEECDTPESLDAVSAAVAGCPVRALSLVTGVPSAVAAS